MRAHCARHARRPCGGATVALQLPTIDRMAGLISHGATIAPAQFRGLPVLQLKLPTGDSATVALHGAQVLQWATAEGRERLFLSARAVMDGLAPIRGGIPVCFPQFNQRGPLPKHGFARTLPWAWESSFADAQRAGVVLRLTHSQATRAMWPHLFEATLRVTVLAGALLLELAVRNIDPQAWDFTAALHTYLGVQDVQSASLEGLDGCDRFDAVHGTRDLHKGTVRFEGEYDAVFAAAASALALHGPEHAVAITQSASFASTVVWTPGAALAARLDDLAPGDDGRFVCVEAAQIDSVVTLPPGGEWSGWQRLTAQP